MLQVNNLIGFGARKARPPLVITPFGAAGGYYFNTQGVTLPAAIPAGTLAVIAEISVGASAPAAVTPAGWAQRMTDTALTARGQMVFKTCGPADSNTTVNTINGTTSMNKRLLLFQVNIPGGTWADNNLGTMFIGTTNPPALSREYTHNEMFLVLAFAMATNANPGYTTSPAPAGASGASNAIGVWWLPSAINTFEIDQDNTGIGKCAMLNSFVYNY